MGEALQERSAPNERYIQSVMLQVEAGTVTRSLDVVALPNVSKDDC